jgi:hypothetical protein
MKETAIVSICYNHKIAKYLVIVEDNKFFTSWSFFMLLNLCIIFLKLFSAAPYYPGKFIICTVPLSKILLLSA